MMKRLAVFILAIVLALTAGLAVACSSVKTPHKDGQPQKTVVSIAITTKPTKTTYNVGDELDLSGMVVTATYSDDTTEAVTGYSHSGYNKNKVGDQTITVTYEEKTATFKVTVKDNKVERTLTGIKIVSEPTKKLYTEGEELDLAGLKVVAQYNAAPVEQEITVTPGMVSGYDKDKLGEQTITVTYEGKTATFKVTVEAAVRALIGIEVINGPTKTLYNKGEQLDITGLKVIAKYNIAPTEQEINVVKEMISGYDKDKIGEQILTVSYTEDGETKTDTFKVTVQEAGRVLQGIAVTKNPDKTVYAKGEDLDLTGLEVTATFSSEPLTQVINVTSDMISGYNKNEVKEQTVTVTYTVGKVTKTATFNVTVIAAAVSKIEITALPTKTEYWQGEPLELAGLVVTATYSDGTTGTVNVTEDMISGYNKNVVGDQTVTVTYMEKTDTFKVKVKPDTLIGIQITKEPDKTTYEVGEGFDVTGMVVVAKYNSHDVPLEYGEDGYSVTGFDSSAERTCTIVIKYKGFEAAPFSVSVIQITYKVKFVTGVDGITAPPEQTVNKNAHASKPTLADRDGYEFLGWFLGEATTPFSFETTPITGDITLKAKWNAIEYKIEYVVYDELATAPAEGKYTIESDTITLPNPTNVKVAHNFIGWYTQVGTGDNGERVFEDKYKVSTIENGSFGDKTFYAYIAQKEVFTFTFNYNYGETPKTVQDNVIDGECATKMNPDPKRTGYNFIGWYEEETCITEYTFDKPIKASGTVVYAKWEAKEITVNFNPDNGGATFTVNVKFDQVIPTQTEPTKLGHKFLGWFRVNEAQTKWNFAKTIEAQLEKEDLTLRAHWEANDYDIEFDPDNGEQIIKVPVTFGTTIDNDKIPSRPEKTGYTFDGWYTEAGQRWSNSQPLTTEGLKLKAKWNANQYTVSFNTDGGTPEVTSKQVYFGESVPTPVTAPTKYGYELEGWYVVGQDGILGKKWDFANDKLATEGLTLKANWTAKDVTIKYVLHYVDANTQAYYTATVKFGGLITDKPADPTEDGYTFLHWHMLDRETVWKFEDKKVEREGLITLEAHWDPNKYDIVYIMGDHAKAITAAEFLKYTYNTKFSLPSADDVQTDEGYNFLGWYIGLNGDGSPIGGKIASIEAGTKGTQTFYAHIVKIPVIKFIYMLNYESAGSRTENILQGSRITEPYQPTRDGYEFKGWYLEPACKNAFSFEQDIMEETTVYAKWDAKTFTITFVIRDGVENEVRYVTADETIKAIEEPKWDGHEFKHWYIDDPDIAYVFGERPIKNVTLYAKWELKEYTVKFDSNGGDPVANEKVKYGNTFTKPTDPDRKGYDFIGWFKDEDLTDDWDFETDVVTEDITLYAKWKIKTFTVTFNLKEGSGTANPQTVEYGKKVTKPTGITKVGYHLTGWELNDRTPWDFDNDVVTEDMWLNAVWEINTYTVTFNTNGGSAVAEQKITHGNKIDTNKITTTRKDWTFVQWVDEDGSAFDPKTETITRDIKLSAQWKNNAGDGTFLYCSSDGKTWSPMYTAKANGDKQWDIEGVELYKGMQFIVVTYSGSNETWYHAAKEDIKQWAFGNILTIKGVEGTKYNDGTIIYNFMVTEYNTMYTGAKWTLYICDIYNDIKMGWVSPAISLGVTIEYTKELRNPADGSAATYTKENAATAEVYIRGSFTNEFEMFKEWSSSSTALTVLKSGNQYTFRKVYLKKGDAFKIYVKGMTVGDSDKGWFGGELVGLNTVITMGNDGSEGNLYLGGIEDGYYDIIFTNGTTRTVKIIKWVAPTIVSVKVTTNPTKTEYWRGEPFSAAGMVVTVTDSDGKSYTVTDYTLGDTSTNAVNAGKEVTVTYGTLSDKFTIVIKDLTVTYDSNGGSSVETDHPKYNGTAKEPEDPTLTGYDFMGWYLVINGEMQSTEYDFDTPVTAPITLKAKWTIHKYTVTFVVEGVRTEQKVEYNKTIDRTLIPKHEKEGHDFLYWKKSGVEFDLDTPITQDIELIAEFVAHTYTVTFDYGYGGKKNIRSVTYNSTVKAYTDTTRAGYTFLGWFKGDDKDSYNFDTPVTEDFTLTAKWNIEHYTITYYVESGLANQVEKGSYTVEDEITLPTPTGIAEGYSFGGWYTDNQYSGTSVDKIARGSTGDKEFYAQITQIPLYNFTFDYNYEGANPRTKVVQFREGTNGAPLSDKPTRPGYNFTGWYTTEDCETEYKFDTPITDGNTVVYAGWDPIMYTVTFETYNGSKVNAIDNLTYGSTVNKPSDPTYTGYNFMGWYKDSKFTTLWKFADEVEPDTVTEDITLYAKWEIKKFTVTFMDGDKTLDSLTMNNVAYDSTIATSPTAPSKPGYTFVGWYKEEALKNAWTFGAGGDKVTDNTTLHAKYDIVTYTIVYYVDGSENNSAGNVVEYKITDNTVVLKNPDKTGHTFDGWYTSGDYKGTKYTELTFAGLFDGKDSKVAIPLYGRFTVNQYVVTFDYNYTGAPANKTVTVIYNTAVPADEIPNYERTDYDFKGWYTDAACSTGKEWKSTALITETTTVYAKWEKAAKVNGLYNGDTLVKEMVDNVTGEEIAAKFLKVESASTASPFKFKIYYNNAVLTVTSFKTGSTTNAKVSANEISITATGVYTVYYRYKAAGTETVGVSIKYHGALNTFVEPNIKDGDGVYVSGTFNTAFVFNENSMNQVMAQKVTVTAPNDSTAVDVTFKYAGSPVTLKKIQYASGVTNAGTDTTVKLYSGTYNFYYNYGDNPDNADEKTGRIWIDGTQTGGPKVVIPTGAVKVSDDTVYLVGKFGDSSVTYEYGFAMKEDSGSQHSITKELAVGDMFAGWHKGWNMWVSKIENSNMSDKVENTTVDGKQYIKVKTAGTYTLYCKHEYGGTNQFWIEYKSSGNTGSSISAETITNGNAYLVGTTAEYGTNWSNKGIKLTKNGDQYELLNIHLTAGDSFKFIVVDSNGNWSWKAIILQSGVDSHIANESGWEKDSNIKVLKSATFNFYVKANSNAVYLTIVS